MKLFTIIKMSIYKIKKLKYLKYYVPKIKFTDDIRIFKWTRVLFNFSAIHFNAFEKLSLI